MPASFRVMFLIVLSVVLYTKGATILAAQDKSWMNYPAAIHPADESFVKSYIDRYQHGLVNLQKDKAVLIRFIEYVLTSKGIPKELKNLAITESYLNLTSISNVGAAGPWQFMPGTARGYGLRVDNLIDERFDLYKSTYAATKILRELYEHFQDWNLVVAAYSCGPNVVDHALRRSGGDDFWDIVRYLPTETQNHVRKFMGVSHITDHNIIAPWRPGDPQIPTPRVDGHHLTTFYITAGYRLENIASKLLISIEKIQELNHDFQTEMIKHGGFYLTLPVDRMPDFLLYRNEILEASIRQSMMDADSE